MELTNTDAVTSFPKYRTARGSIDLLLISSDAEIIIVETRLLRNSESTRQVLEQTIDCIKAFSEESVDDLIRKVKSRLPNGFRRLISDVSFAALVQENISAGNYKVIVVGDYIHPNAL